MLWVAGWIAGLFALGVLADDGGGCEGNVSAAKAWPVGDCAGGAGCAAGAKLSGARKAPARGSVCVTRLATSPAPTRNSARPATRRHIVFRRCSRSAVTEATASRAMGLPQAAQKRPPVVGFPQWEQKAMAGIEYANRFAAGQLSRSRWGMAEDAAASDTIAPGYPHRRYNEVVRKILIPLLALLVMALIALRLILSATPS